MSGQGGYPQGQGGDYPQGQGGGYPQGQGGYQQGQGGYQQGQGGYQQGQGGYQQGQPQGQWSAQGQPNGGQPGQGSGSFGPPGGPNGPTGPAKKKSPLLIIGIVVAAVVLLVAVGGIFIALGSGGGGTPGAPITPDSSTPPTTQPSSTSKPSSSSSSSSTSKPSSSSSGQSPTSTSSSGGGSSADDVDLSNGISVTPAEDYRVESQKDTLAVLSNGKEVFVAQVAKEDTDTDPTQVVDSYHRQLAKNYTNVRYSDAKKVSINSSKLKAASGAMQGTSSSGGGSTKVTLVTLASVRTADGVTVVGTILYGASADTDQVNDDFKTMVNSMLRSQADG